MRVHASTTNRPALSGRGTGLYLMELRQHVSETHSRRHKLAVTGWSLRKVEVVPILASGARAPGA